MKIEVYKCDVCGTVKGESNHWYIGSFDPAAFNIYPWEGERRGDWIKHICGQQCAQKFLENWLSK
jgi:hypothetical protein